MKRHKWDKHFYNGKFSSFEFGATCKVCGCKRKRLTFGVEYTTLEGKHFEYAPDCIPMEENETTESK